MARFSIRTRIFRLRVWKDRQQNLTTIPKVLVERTDSGEEIMITGGKIFKDGDKVRLTLKVSPCNE